MQTENFVSQLLLASYGIIITTLLQYYIIQPIIDRQLASQLYIKLRYSKVEEFPVNCQQFSYIHPATLSLLSIRVASDAQLITTGSCNSASYMIICSPYIPVTAVYAIYFQNKNSRNTAGQLKGRRINIFTFLTKFFLFLLV